jgi:predicted NBD/HSP70 family sugar kinase
MSSATASAVTSIWRIRREATEEAEHYLAERRREADAQAEARRRGLEQALEVIRRTGPQISRAVAELTAALEQAVEGGRGDAMTASAPAPAETPPAPPPVPEPPAPEAVLTPAAAAEQPGSDSSHVRQRALIRATQLAVQGADRATVVATLEREFALDDAPALVSEILGE